MRLEDGNMNMNETNNAEDIKKCAYCGSERPLSELKKSKLTYIMNKQVRQDYRLYCHDKPCAGHDQMAHEG
jgi:hypothetical protein